MNKLESTLDATLVVKRFNSFCNPLVFAIVKSPSAIVFCLLSNAVCNPSVFAIVKSPSDNVFCFPFNAVCNPSVFAMVKSPSAIAFNNVVKFAVVV